MKCLAGQITCKLCYKTMSATVTVTEGKVRGIKAVSQFSGAEYYAFYGIPYAQPPEGELRFKNPVKVKPWKNVLDARKEKSGCIQFSMFLFDHCGSEDCLYVNIYTPKLPCKGEPLKAVVAAVHPGGHLWGSPDPSQYGSPDYVMHRDIVYVTIGYRLHILGFLNLDLDDCPGNQGLKDVMLALEWIKANVQFFNGDPENITFLGSSSGSSIVQYLMISPTNKGLFHKAVLMGHYISNCTIPIQESHIEEAFELGYMLGFEGTGRKRLLRFLKSVPAELFVEKLKRFHTKFDTNKAYIFPCGQFIPTIDRGKYAVLPASPRQLIGSMQRLPMIFGMCEKEAAIGFTKTHRETTENNFMTSWYQNPWGWSHSVDADGRKFVTQQVKSFYFKDAPQHKVPLSLKIDVITDAAFSDVYDTLIDVVSAELPTSVYVYKFQYDGEVATLKTRFGPLLDEPIQGTWHSDDFGYWASMFKATNEKTIQVIETFTKLITTFARTGDPNCEGSDVQWRPTNPQKPCHLNINNTIEMIDSKLNGERFEFWDNLKMELFNKKFNDIVKLPIDQ